MTQPQNIATVVEIAISPIFPYYKVEKFFSFSKLFWMQLMVQGWGLLVRKAFFQHQLLWFCRLPEQSICFDRCIRINPCRSWYFYSKYQFTYRKRYYRACRNGCTMALCCFVSSAEREATYDSRVIPPFFHISKSTSSYTTLPVAEYYGDRQHGCWRQRRSGRSSWNGGT